MGAHSFSCRCLSSRSAIPRNHSFLSFFQIATWLLLKTMPSKASAARSIPHSPIVVGGGKERGGERLDWERRHWKSWRGTPDCCCDPSYCQAEDSAGEAGQLKGEGFWGRLAPDWGHSDLGGGGGGGAVVQHVLPRHRCRHPLHPLQDPQREQQRREVDLLLQKPEVPWGVFETSTGVGASLCPDKILGILRAHPDHHPGKQTFSILLLSFY